MNDLQTKLFETVRHAVNNKKRWIDEVAGVLHKSKQAVYKKVQGESCLTLDEAVLLASHYQVMLDPLIRPDPFVQFAFPPPSDLRHGANALASIVASLEGQTDAELWCAGIEIPFLHDHLLPEIAAFREFLQAQTSAQPSRSLFCLSGAMTKRESVPEMQKLASVSTVEFWNPMILDVTLSQIRYALQSSFFREDADAFLLCDALTRFLVEAERMASLETKSTGGHAGGCFQLYCNEISQQVNMILVKSQTAEVLWLGFANPPWLVSQSEQVIREATTWLERLKAHATKISGAAARDRATLFAGLHKRIERTRTELEAIIHIRDL